jgi:cytochrome b561
VQIGLHWTIAVLILLVQVPVAIVMQALEPGPTQNVLYTLHKNVGLVVLILAVVRLVWRLAQPVPYLPSDLPRWQVVTAHGTHVMLYGLILLLPISGFLYTALSGYPVPFLLVFELSALVAEDEAAGEFWQSVHNTVPWVLVAVVALHVAGAMQHHFVRRDGVFVRMLSSRADLAKHSPDPRGATVTGAGRR